MQEFNRQSMVRPVTGSTLFTNIGQLVTNDPLHDGTDLGVVADAALIVVDQQVVWTGPAMHAPAADRAFSVSSATVIPGFVDSHTHLMFAGDRSADYARRFMGGAREYGGRSTIAATRQATDAELRRSAADDVARMLRHGTTTLEIKTGYGLTVRDEARAAAIAREFTAETTFMGAHVVPEEFDSDRDSYVDLVVGQMLEASHPYCKWIDVWCEDIAFDEAQSRRILAAGAAKGLELKVHANQYGTGPGVRLACELGASSVDHCTFLSASDLELLGESNTVATLLPAVEFCTRSVFSDGRAILDAGGTVALATDCNPGSAYTTSMPFCISLAVRELGMTPAEALWSATAGGAAALRRPDIGALTVGARADFVVLDAPNYIHLAYRPGTHLVDAVIVGGEVVCGDLGEAHVSR